MIVLGMDLGTSGIKVMLIENARRIFASATRPIAVSIPHVGWSEQDPDLWVAAVFD